MMRILEVSRPKEVAQLMRQIKVDPYGTKIMLPKAITHLVKINRVSAIAANILKQEMLSLGGEVAIARDAITGKIKKTDCLLMGNLSQFNRLSAKLKPQPFGLNNLAEGLSRAIDNYSREAPLNLGKHKFDFSRRSYIMGIVNLTPDSFSGDGLCQSTDRIIEYAQQMVKDGADIIDLGGESSRPGAKSVSLKEELRRTIPAIKILAKKIRVPISIDTYKPQVAREALDNGALMVNDITALAHPEMRKIVAKYKAAAVLMHMKGEPRTMQQNPRYRALIDEIIAFLGKSIDTAFSCGISRDKVVIDPGLGFGKSFADNLEILRRLSEFKILGQPILVGPSRKSFIGKILNAAPRERLSGTISSCCLAVKNGANIVRVHDVKAVKQALRVSDAILYQ